MTELGRGHGPQQLCCLLFRPGGAFGTAPVQEVGVLHVGDQVQQGHGGGVVPVQAGGQQFFEDGQGDFPDGRQALYLTYRGTGKAHLKSVSLEK